MSRVWGHPFHCHRPRSAAGPNASGPSVTINNIVTVINVINITGVVAANPKGVDGKTPPTPGHDDKPKTGGNTAGDQKHSAIYLVDLWQKGTFPSSDDPRDWRIGPVAKAIWYYKEGDLSTMNKNSLPDLEFQLPGKLPNAFDWEGYSIGRSPARPNSIHSFWENADG